jgi:acyl-ACP thioesterase
MDETKHHIRNIKVQHHECSPEGTLRLQSLLDHFQDIAQEHVAMAGVGVKALADKGMMWVLSRIRIGCRQYVAGEDLLSLDTCSDGVSGVFVIRQFRLCLPDGTPCIWATSQWLVLDKAAMRPLRPDRILPEEMLVRNGDSLGFGDLGKIQPRALCGDGIRYDVRHSNLDRNNHLNNAHYGSFISDVLADTHGGTLPQLRELQINFCHQALLGDRICVRAGNEQDGEIYVDGRSDDCKTLYFTATALVAEYGNPNDLC